MGRLKTILKLERANNKRDEIRLAKKLTDQRNANSLQHEKHYVVRLAGMPYFKSDTLI